ncbi:MAG: BatA and WFA domain-containing protein [Clostridiales bacterium]|nr:BatA and WFA domain-containing protein [Clostridiales bacterium]
MTFANPLGLLGLLAIPVLIIIYIIKSKYTEQTINSTYLWTLSEKFLKRKNPINKITGIISLILQILAVVLISWALAHPVFTLPGKAMDYCFILDGSGSMQTVQGGESRFDKGKERIRDMISSAADGSTYTLIKTGNTTEMIMKEVSDKKTALRRLDAVDAAYVASNLSTASQMATTYLQENPSCKFYLITDRTVSYTQNVEVINVAGSVSNYALDGVGYSYADDGKLFVSGTAYSYESDATLTVEVFADGARQAVASTDVSVAAGENGTIFSVGWTPEKETFSSLRVAIKQSDNMPLDNQVTLYGARSGDTYKALIVSNTPDFLRFMLSSAGIEYKVIAATDAAYAAETDDYGLYIFHNYTPDAMPAEGAVWFVYPDGGVDETSGFSRGGAQTLSSPKNLDFAKEDDLAKKDKPLIAGVEPNLHPMVNEYLKLGTYRNFTSVVTCEDSPVVLAGSNSYGNREVVFGIDLIETSDFAMSYNGSVILYNLIEYTFPSLVNETALYCGEALPVNVLANCTSIRVESPSGKTDYLSTSDAIVEYELTEVGEYTVTATIKNSRQTAKVYAQLPVAERNLNATESYFFVTGETSDKKRDGTYEDLLYAFIILAVIVVADWAVYCYEQYQLR